MQHDATPLRLQIGESMPVPMQGDVTVLGQGVFLIKSHACKLAFPHLFCTCSCRNPPLMMLLVQLSRLCAKSARIDRTFNVWGRVRGVFFFCCCLCVSLLVDFLPRRS